MNPDNDTNSTPKASALRQLAALFYDGLLLMAIMLVAFLPITFLTSQGIIGKNNPLLQIYLFGICFLYFGWFWTRNGKTIGMRVWHIKIVDMNGNLITWPMALARFLSGLPVWILLCLALFRHYAPEQIQQSTLPDYILDMPVNLLFLTGLVWLVLDHLPGFWRDKLTKTRIIRTKKPI